MAAAGFARCSRAKRGQLPAFFAAAAVGIIVGPRWACAAATTAAEGREAQATGSASLLLELLRELQHEAEVGLHLSSASASHCRSARNQRLAMAEALQRHLQETEAAHKRLGAEEDRVQSEQALANATVSAQEQHLVEASAVVNRAKTDLAEEKRELDEALQAADSALELLRMQQEGSLNAADASLQDSLAQLRGSGALTDTESNLAANYAQAPQGSGGSIDDTKSQELRQMLVDLRTRLEADKRSTDQEQQAMIHKFKVFQERLNSSILETNLQSANVAMEAARRKRERALLEGRQSELSSLSRAVEASRSAINAVCFAEEKQKGKIAQLIRTESAAVKAMLKELPLSGSEWSTEEEVSPTFLQITASSSESEQSQSSIDHAVEQLTNLAHQFPQEATWYSDAAQTLDAERPSSDSSSQSAPGADSSLQSIEAFVAASSDSEQRPSPTKTPSVHKLALSNIKTAYGSLLNHIFAEERALAENQSACELIRKSAEIDRATLKRSSKQTKAKLNILRSAIVQLEEDAKNDIKQQEAIEQQSKQMDSITAEARSARANSLKLLGARSTQLVALAEDLSQKASSNERGASERAKSLLEVLAKHRAELEREVAPDGAREKLISAARVADAAVVRQLREAARHGKRRLTRLRAEAATLESLARGRELTLAAFGHDGNAASTDDVLSLCGESSNAQPTASQQLKALRQQERALRGAIASVNRP